MTAEPILLVTSGEVQPQRLRAIFDESARSDGPGSGAGLGFLGRGPGGLAYYPLDIAEDHFGPVGERLSALLEDKIWIVSYGRASEFECCFCFEEGKLAAGFFSETVLGLPEGEIIPDPIEACFESAGITGIGRGKLEKALAAMGPFEEICPSPGLRLWMGAEGHGRDSPPGGARNARSADDRGPEVAPPAQIDKPDKASGAWWKFWR